MNPSFLQKMFAAARLTRGGRLTEATQEIQQAFSDAAAASVEASALVTAGAAQGEVLDGLVREVDTDANDMRARRRSDAGAESAEALRTAKASAEAPHGTFTDGSFTSAAGTRGFKLFVPGGFEGRELPLVVMLHGCTQDPDDFAAGTRMNTIAQEQGFVVLYPAQAPRSNAHKCWNWFVPADQHRGHGEPALIADLTRDIVTRHGIDARRIFVAGLSAGGAMAAILAREYPDVFAAAGVHSGLAAGAARDVASAFTAMKSGATAGDDASTGAPLIVFHGDSDSTVHVQNGTHVVDAALGDAEWQALREAGKAGTGRAFTRTVYRPAGSGADADTKTSNAPSRAEQWVVHGGDHAWSGGDAKGSFTDPRGPDASREMLRFFHEHPLTRSTASR